MPWRMAYICPKYKKNWDLYKSLEFIQIYNYQEIEHKTVLIVRNIQTILFHHKTDYKKI